MKTRARKRPPFKAPASAGASKGAAIGAGLILTGCIVENLVILQPIKRVVKGAGWTRVLYLAYLVGADERTFSPVVLNEDEGLALMAHLNRGGSVAVDGQIYTRKLALEAVRVDGKEMTEYFCLEGVQRVTVLQAMKDKVTVSAFLQIKHRARVLFLKPAPEVEPRVNYASVA